MFSDSGSEQPCKDNSPAAIPVAINPGSNKERNMTGTLIIDPTSLSGSACDADSAGLNLPACYTRQYSNFIKLNRPVLKYD
ncbi:hypothetical protein AS19_25720 [Alcanivorax sp. NBRC 101098]|nr:hypothetical protein AS19_25720 [Alcanivorax sp. NBRC 101098]